MPFAKVQFKKYIINIDLSKLNTVTDDTQIANTSSMLNIKELSYTVDSLTTTYNKEMASVAENSYQRLGINYNVFPDSLNPKVAKTPDLTSILSNTEKSRIYEIAQSDISSSVVNSNMNALLLSIKKKDINNHWLSIHEKFVLVASCIFMFFIGAPLGAITYYFINTFGKKLAQESGISPFLGSWISSIILIPLAIFLTRKATNDSGSINFDVITDPIKNLFLKLAKRKNLK